MRPDSQTKNTTQLSRASPVHFRCQKISHLPVYMCTVKTCLKNLPSLSVQTPVLLICLLAASPQHAPSQRSVTTDSNRPMSADRFEGEVTNTDILQSAYKLPQVTWWTCTSVLHHVTSCFVHKSFWCLFSVTSPVCNTNRTSAVTASSTSQTTCIIKVGTRAPHVSMDNEEFSPNQTPFEELQLWNMFQQEPKPSEKPESQL